MVELHGPLVPKDASTGDMEWVEIQWTVLPAGERAATTPDDTSATPYVARVRGFTPAPVRVGDIAYVVTAGGRRLQGQVVRIRPGHDHSFGRPLPAWLRMQQFIRTAISGDQLQ